MTAGKEVREPSELTPHPKNGEIYGDSVDQSFIDRIEEHGIQDKVKVTPESHFTDAEGTIIGGHRRVRAAKQLDLSVPVEVVGPFSTPVEEVKALLIDNDHRDKSPVQEIREVDEWKEVYKESPELETDSIVEEACQHVSFKKSTYWNGKKVQKAAKKGVWGQQNEDLSKQVVNIAQEQWEKLKQGETTINGAHDEVKEAKESAGAKEIPESRGIVGDDSVKEEIDKRMENPVQASFRVSTTRLDQVLAQIRLPNSLRPTDTSGQSIAFGVHDDYVDIWTDGEGVTSRYTLSGEFVEDVSPKRDGPTIISVLLSDVRRYLDIINGKKIDIQLRGVDESPVATSFNATDGQLHIWLKAPTGEEGQPEPPEQIPEEYSDEIPEITISTPVSYDDTIEDIDDETDEEYSKDDSDDYGDWEPGVPE